MAHNSKWQLVIGSTSFATGELDSELYDDTAAAFQEMLDIQGVPITFNGVQKDCVSDRMRESFEWQSVGFVPLTTVHVSLLDSDFAFFSGIDSPQSTVIFEGLTFQVTEIDRSSANPIVRMTLTKSK